MLGKGNKCIWAIVFHYTIKTLLLANDATVADFVACAGASFYTDRLHKAEACGGSIARIDVYMF